MNKIKEIPVQKYMYPYVKEYPVMSDVTQFNKYEGLSIKEIEDKYGWDEAVGVYQFAVRSGIDLTQPKITPTFKSEYKITIAQETDNYETVVYIKDVHSNNWVRLFSVISFYNKPAIIRELTYRHLKYKGLL